MIVFIEYVIIDNMVMNTLILVLTLLTIKEKINKARIFFSAFIGTLGAIGVSLVNINGFFIIPLKLMLGFFMVLIICNNPTKKRLLRYYCVFLAYTFILGGCILALLYLLEADVTDALAITYVSGVPIGILVGGAAIVIALAYTCVKSVYKKRSLERRIVKASVTLDREYPLRAYIDSGNLLRYKGLPVYFAVGKELKSTLLSIYSRNILDVRNQIGKNEHIPYATVNGEGQALAIKPPKFSIEGKQSDCYIAWSKLKGEEDYDIIIGETDF